MMKILKGHIIFTKTKDKFELYENSYIVIKEGKVLEIVKELDKKYDGIEVKNYGNALIIPSFTDLHIHAPQYMQMGIGLDLELIEWLDQYTFMIESRFENPEYAKNVYPYFVDALYKHGTLRSCIFSTIHDDSTRILIKELEKKGLSAYVGKVNMDQNSPDSLKEDTKKSLELTRNIVADYADNKMIKPIITPRFAPSCTKEMMKGLGEISIKSNIPVQTHIGENRDEVKWVKELFPGSKSYADVYDRANLYGKQKTLLAHSIYMEESEIELAKNENVYLVHCPFANLNLASGIMPLTKYLDMGLQIGLGSDVGAGHEIGMNKVMASAIQCSKMRYVMDNTERILNEPEVFYLGTKVNGSFFGNTGSFEKGYSFDALIIKDEFPLMSTATPIEQLQRFLYCGGPESIVARYLEGEEI